MSLVCPDQVGEILFLQYIVGLVDAGNPVLHLYANDITPSDSTVIGDLTEVSTLAGYVPVTLVSSNWTTTQVSGVTTAVYSEKAFSMTTAVTAYGYYITTTSNQLLVLERFSGAPFQMPSGGGAITITPKITLS
jgi:hypothetical protein